MRSCLAVRGRAGYLAAPRSTLLVLSIAMCGPARCQTTFRGIASSLRVDGRHATAALGLVDAP